MVSSQEFWEICSAPDNFIGQDNILHNLHKPPTGSRNPSISHLQVVPHRSGYMLFAVAADVVCTVICTSMRFSLCQLKCLFLATRDRAHILHTVSVTNFLHDHHLSKSLKTFLGEMLCARSATLEILGSRFNVTFFLGHCVLELQKSDVYAFQFSKALSTAQSTSCV